MVQELPGDAGAEGELVAIMSEFEVSLEESFSFFKLH